MVYFPVGFQLQFYCNKAMIIKSSIICHFKIKKKKPFVFCFDIIVIQTYFIYTSSEGTHNEVIITSWTTGSFFLCFLVRRREPFTRIAYINKSIQKIIINDKLIINIISSKQITTCVYDHPIFHNKDQYLRQKLYFDLYKRAFHDEPIKTHQL